MSKIWYVAGENGKGNDGHILFGLYPSEELAVARLEALDVLYLMGEDGCENMWYDEVEVGPEGADTRICIEG